MRCMTESEMYEIDRKSAEDYLLPTTVLMENAGRALADGLKSKLSKEMRICVVTGPGNNGGDGYVLARTLLNEGYAVEVLETVTEAEMSTDEQLYRQIYLKYQGTLTMVDDVDVAAYLVDKDIIVDALFGIGLTGRVRAPFDQWIETINQSGKCVISLDVPSGVSSVAADDLLAIRANHTFIIEAPKPSLFIEATRPFYGEVTVVSIGLPKKELLQSSLTVWQQEDVKQTLQKREPFSHKGNYVHLLVIGGSAFMPGSVKLASTGAYRTGAGLVTVMTSEEALPMLANGLNEVMYQPLEPEALTDEALAKYDVIACGMGLSETAAGRALLSRVLETKKPLVIDASGLNLLSEDLSRLERRQALTVLTPHPKEMARLSGLSVAAIKRQPFRVVADFAKAHQVYLVLKGAMTLSASPSGEININTTGNSGLSKGGSGDLLTGMVASRVLSDDTPLAGISNAVFLHGLAADLAVSDRHSSYDLTATEVSDYLGRSFQAVLRKNIQPSINIK